MGVDAGYRSNADLGDDGYCTPAARVPKARRVVMVDNYPSYSVAVAVAEVAVKVAELGCSWRCKVVVVGWLAGEEGSFALLHSNRLLPCFDITLCRFSMCVECVCSESMYEAVDGWIIHHYIDKAVME